MSLLLAHIRFDWRFLGGVFLDWRLADVLTGVFINLLTGVSLTF